MDARVIGGVMCCGLWVGAAVFGFMSGGVWEALGAVVAAFNALSAAGQIWDRLDN